MPPDIEEYADHGDVHRHAQRARFSDDEERRVTEIQHRRQRDRGEHEDVAGRCRVTVSFSRRMPSAAISSTSADQTTPPAATGTPRTVA
jgi:hypothetical protein